MVRIQYQEPPQRGRHHHHHHEPEHRTMNIVKPSIAKANADMQAAQAEIERGNRAKKKLEDLVA